MLDLFLAFKNTRLLCQINDIQHNALFAIVDHFASLEADNSKLSLSPSSLNTIENLIVYRLRDLLHNFELVWFANDGFRVSARRCTQ